jgi:hypothetical protein
MSVQAALRHLVRGLGDVFVFELARIAAAKARETFSIAGRSTVIG